MMKVCLMDLLSRLSSLDPGHSTLDHMTDLAFLYITAPDRETALSLARTAVEERLAACGNILDGMTSVYRWEAETRHDSEVVLILKTRSELVERLTARVIELHPYETPCVVALQIAAGSEKFFDWVRAETT
jgi:periplasmic divalent cation tolerance protein